MTELLSCNIIEKDTNDDVLWAWTYPSITEEQKNIILDKCNFSTNSFQFGQYYKKWFYISYAEITSSTVLPHVKHIAFVLWTKDLNPEKYEKLCHVLSKAYLDSGNPTAVLQIYLSIVTKGIISGKENGTFMVKDYISTNNLPKNSIVKNMMKYFGLEIILVYTALLIKKRLVVYHHSSEKLLEWILSVPLLMAHRNITDYLFPSIDLSNEDLAQLKDQKFYVAGFHDNNVLSHSELYDVLVNIPAKEITISPNAKESLVMTKVHKDIALFMVQLSESELTEEQIIKALSERTKELLNQLRTLCKTYEDGRSLVSMETLKEKKFSPAKETFLVQLALAEDILLNALNNQQHY